MMHDCYTPNPDYEPDFGPGSSDWHAVYTIQLGELIEGGIVDFSSEEWDFDSFDDEQRNRFWEKFENRYRWYEIGIVPPYRWMQTLLAKLNEIMPKYKPLYRALKDGYNPLQEGSERRRDRAIFSEYPQTVLKPETQDYASTGNEAVSEAIRDGSIIDKALELRNRYSDVDALILDELEYLFIPLTTANINGF